MKNFKNLQEKGNLPSIPNPFNKTTDVVENITENLPTENLSSLKYLPNELTDKVENVTEKLPLPGLNLLIGMFSYIKNFFPFIFTFISNIFSGIKTLFQVFIAIPVKIYLFLLQAIGKIWSWLKAVFKACVNLIVKIYEFIIDKISQIFLGVKILFQIFIAIPVKTYLFIVQIVGKIRSWIKAVFKACINLIIKIYEFIIDTVKKIFLWVKILFQVFIAIPVKIYLFIVDVVGKIWSFIKYIVKTLIAFITTIGNFLKLLFLNPLSLLTNPLQSLKSLGNSGGEIVDNLSGGLGEVTDNLSEGLEEVTDNLSEGLEEVTDNLSEGIGEVTDNLSEGIGEVVDNLSGGIGAVTDNLLGSKQNKKTKNQKTKPLGKPKKKPESDPPPSQPDSSELPTDIVEQFQLLDEASPSGIPLPPESSEPPTDIEQEDPDEVSPSELPETLDVVYKKTKGLIYIQDLYSRGKASNLYTLDIESGKTVLIGSMGMHIVDIAFCGNILYGIRWRDQKTTDLVRINPTTAKTTIIGKLGNSKVASLAFSKHRKTLYAMSPQTLLRVNVKTGAGRIIRSYKSYYPFYCGGLAFDSKGRAYSNFGNNNNRQRYLMRLNHNGTPIAVGGASGVKNYGCLDFYGDELFAIFNGQIFKYDLVTGKAKFVTYIEQNVSWAGMSVKLHPSINKMS
ncbi:hypothetical protein [Okeania sp. SIO1I7]|uniref:phage tail protein n=1 Tax=Okeania sp. SIO1I7 TaxID=2607772 RepID=UPI0013F8ED0B|nr:hypothetical protein [Okeania sp. SIO1I7]NET29710.1 hypothetical protein [Okeania sp. SIO1I7]